MVWSELYGKENEPTCEQIQEYVNTALWGELADYLQQTYNIKPQIEYSGCMMDKGAWKGWNVKYKKVANPCVRFTRSRATFFR